VPNGQTIESPDDLSLSASVLSRWPDGSASVVVLAGEVNASSNSSRQIALRPATRIGAPLTAARVGQLVTSIAFDFGTVGNAAIADFSAPQFVWWANERVICTRYRQAIGAGGLEAVIDVHAFASDHAFVEVVIENCKFDVAHPVEPTEKAYSNATITLNGALIANVGTAAGPNAAHGAWRAWYCSGWIGGDPQIDVTHNTGSLQAHPWFWKTARPVTTDMQTSWAKDFYEPLSTGARLPRKGMAGTGEGGNRNTWIGQLPPWDADYIATGNRYAGRASINNSLSALTYSINYRHGSGVGATNEVPTVAQLKGWRKRTAPRSFPQDTYSNSHSQAAWWEDAHQPAGPLVAFLLRPSPVFIELAQKIAAWNCTENTSDGTRTYSSGRTRAWAYRNYAIASFLTPSAQAHKAALQTLLMGCAADVLNYSTTAINKLDTVWDTNYNSFPSYGDLSSSRPKGQCALWQHHWLLCVFHTVDKAKVLAGTDATTWTRAADWLAKQPIRYVNEAANGEWRLQNYLTTFSDTAGGQLPKMRETWGETLDADYTDAAPTNAGKWIFIEHNPSSNANWDKWSSASESKSIATSNYAAIYWAALVAAVERDIPNASAAWDRVVTNNGIINLSGWLDGATDNPRYNRYPRNK
jgi:hypothetical protein